MKKKLFILSIISLVLFTGCNSSKIKQDKKNVERKVKD